MTCKCYHAERNFLGRVGVCWGTKECEACSCAGDETKCDFYDYVRERANSRAKTADTAEGLVMKLQGAEAAIAGLKRMIEQMFDAGMLRWIPVTERLPKYGERVLVFGGATMYVAYYDKNRYGGESWHKLNSKSHYCNPTHWMPLPEPPKEKEQCQG